VTVQLGMSASVLLLLPPPPPPLPLLHNIMTVHFTIYKNLGVTDVLFSLLIPQIEGEDSSAYNTNDVSPFINCKFCVHSIIAKGVISVLVQYFYSSTSILNNFMAPKYAVQGEC